MLGKSEPELPGRVLVTGGRGFVGRAVVERLARTGWEVFATHSPGSEPGSEPNIAWREVDLLDGGAARDLLKRVEPGHLIHLAWASGPGIYESPENIRWAEAGRDLVDAFVAVGGRRAVFVGTCAEYDWNAVSDLGVFGEGARLAGGGAYGEAKRMLSADFAKRVRNGDLTGVWARLFFLFGPHEPASRLVPAVIGGLLAGTPVETTHGRQVRDYLYVVDAADALVALLESRIEGAVNIGSGRGARLEEVILEIADALDGRRLLRMGALAAPEGEAAAVVADTTRLTVELGWRAGYDRGRALAETIDWWRSRRS